MATIKLNFREKNYEVETETTPLMFLHEHSLPIHEPVASIVNGVISSLNKHLQVDSRIDFIELSSSAGNRIYQTSVVFLFLAAFQKKYSDRQVFIQHALGNGIFVEVTGETLKEKEIHEIEEEMFTLANKQIPITRVKKDWDIGIDEFRKKNRADLVDLLRYYPPNILRLYILEGIEAYSSLPPLPNTKYMKEFKLYGYENGVVIQVPDFTFSREVPAFQNQPKLYATYQEAHQWSRILKVRTVGQLNHHIMTDQIGDVIKVAEALHEKKVAQIADTITHKNKIPRLILISGPSSSGKTTFSKRLGIQLRVNGYRPLTVSLDNYFVDRVNTPKDENGEYDFESLYAIDVQLFKTHLAEMLAGKEVEIPRFDFRKGSRKYPGVKTRLEPDQLIIVEGIHALNSELTDTIPTEEKHKIYVSALTQLNIHNHARIPTSDTRALRRIVRDRLFRGYTAEETLNRWPLVRSGEHKNIFPSQENADVVFNSAICYELAVLKTLAEKELLKIEKDSPVYPEARRLLKFLSYFLPIQPEGVPNTSILREFIGSSSFDY